MRKEKGETGPLYRRIRAPCYVAASSIECMCGEKIASQNSMACITVRYGTETCWRSSEWINTADIKEDRTSVCLSVGRTISSCF